jgi:hypothetical protein
VDALHHTEANWPLALACLTVRPPEGLRHVKAYQAGYGRNLFTIDTQMDKVFARAADRIRYRLEVPNPVSA